MAGFLSLLTIGLGQIYNGQAKKGLFILFLPIILLLSIYVIPFLKFFWGLGFFVLVNLILKFYAIIDAFLAAKKMGEVTLKWYQNPLFYFLIILIQSGMVYFSTPAGKTFESFKVPSLSMKPTLLIGDYLMADLTYFKKNEPKRGDVALILVPIRPEDPRTVLKRILGLPGDQIEIKGKKLFINNQIYPEDYVLYEKGGTGDFGPVTVQEDHLFVLGDNRDNAVDSRLWGQISMDHFIGKPLYIWFSKKDRKRIGQSIE